MNSTLKSLLFWMVLVVIGVLVWNFSTRFQRSDQAISFSTFMTQVTVRPGLQRHDHRQRD